MSISADDPFTLVYRSIWAALRNCPQWTALFRTGNQISFDGNGWPIKTSVAPGDLPEVVLLQSRFTMQPYTSNSRSCNLSQTYPLVCSTQDLNSGLVNAAKWQTLRALFQSGSALGQPQLVKRWTIGDATDDALNGMAAYTRGVNRWVSLLNINVEMAILKTDVASGAFPVA